LKPTQALLIFLLSILLPLSACAAPDGQVAVGILSGDGTQGLSEGMAALGVEQKSGYQRAEKALGVQAVFTYRAESLLPEDIQVAVRGMVEDPQAPVVALAGATTNTSTTRLAALANFFSLPLVVPSAVGDNLMPSNNLWAFRLSAPGSAHAAYLFGELLNRQTLADLSGDEAQPGGLSLAIFYEQNTFSESTAVETAKAAMAQDVEIGYYGYFDPDAPEKARVLESLSAMQTAGVDLVYLIASNPTTAGTIVRAFRDFFVPEDLPLLLGQSGGFASREFLGSPEARGVFILRQQIVPERCPDGVDSLAEAQSYAAVYLLNFALEQSLDQFPSGQTPLLSARREAVRDSLKNSSLNLPCLGLTSFDNSGQNRNLQFELLYAESGTPRPARPEKLLELLAPKLNRDPFQ
jgi:hypothetical protein